jgi:DNA-binding SARP family transcriptional activator/tetratricopeptide (TPR) repeat protein/TolB-like protein
MSLRLRTFGGVSLERAGRPLAGKATQRRRLALLVLLAAARDRGMSRDKLLALLWPELETERARRTLSQTLYWIRRELGEDVVVPGIDDLRLTPTLLASDLHEFDDALARGDDTAAIALYAGPFLDGFFVNRAQEFEEWAEAERERRRQSYWAALERAATKAAGTNDHMSAVQHWRTRAAAEPLNSRPVLELMKELATVGDRAGAIRHAQIHDALLRGELDGGADAAVLRLARELRAEPPRSPAPQLALPVSPVDQPPDRASELPARVSRPRRWRQRALLVAGVGLLVGGPLSVLPRRHAGDGPAMSRRQIAVLPFAVRGSGDLRLLREGMPELISRSIDGVGDYRSTDPQLVLTAAADTLRALNRQTAADLARRLGAGHYIVGEVIGIGDRIRIHASLYPGKADRPVAESTVEGARDQIFALVDEMTARLLAPSSLGPPTRAASLSVRTTHSLAALRAFLEGEREYRAGRPHRAAELLQRAVAEDSGFALAHYRLSVALNEAEGFSHLSRGAADRAVALSQHLIAPDRLLIRAYRAQISGEADEGERLYETIVDHYPEYVEARVRLGQLRYTFNLLRGRSVQEARSDYEGALRLDPHNTVALNGLRGLALLRRDYGAADSLTGLMDVERASATGAESAVVDPDLALLDSVVQILSSGDRAREERLFGSIRRSQGAVPLWVFWQTRINTDNHEAARRLAYWMADSAPDPGLRPPGNRAVAGMEVFRGRFRAAWARLESEPSPDRWFPVERAATFALLPFLTVAPAKLDAVRRALEETEPHPPPQAPASPLELSEIGLSLDSARTAVKPFLLGVASARLRDTAAARRYERQLFAIQSPVFVAVLAKNLGWTLRAEIERAAGNAEEALAELDRVRGRYPPDLSNLSDWYSGEHTRYLRAELLFALGRLEEADRWYRTHSEVYEFGRLYEPHSHFRRGQIAERLGRESEAGDHFRKVVELWGDGDPEVQPFVNEAERRLSALRAR